MLSEIQLYIDGVPHNNINIYPEDAADILSDSLLAFFEAIEKGRIRYLEEGEVRLDKLQQIEIFDEGGSLKQKTTDNQYLMGIIKNKLREFYRTMNKKRENGEDIFKHDGGINVRIDLEEEGMSQREQVAFIRYALRRLSYNDRIIAFTNSFTNLSNEELHELFPHLTEGALRTMKSRALERYKALIKQLAEEFEKNRGL